MSEQPRTRLNLAATAAVLAVNFSFVLTIAFAPKFFGRPIAEGYLTSVGLAVGIVVMVGDMAATVIYTLLVNRSDRDKPSVKS